MMKLSYFLKTISLYVLPCILLGSAETRAEPECLKSFRLLASSKNFLGGLFHERVSLESLAKQPFFKTRKADTPSLLLFIESLPTSPERDRALARLISYQNMSQTRTPVFKKQSAQTVYGTLHPRIEDAYQFFANRSEDDLRQDRAQASTYRSRAYVRAVYRYRWLILGTTIFVLWEPIQAEIKSAVYSGFNFSRSILTPTTPDKEWDALVTSVMGELRTLYLVSSEQYPWTTQSSRNTLTYVYDVVLKRRDSLNISVLAEDKQAIRSNLLFLYLLPSLFTDVFDSPLSEILRETYAETLERFDPEKKYRKEFEQLFRSSSYR